MNKIAKILLLALALSGCSLTNSNEFKKWKEMKNIIVKTEIEHKVLKYNDNNIHYYLSGDKSKDAIVFLHPAFGDHRSFDQQIDFFSNKYRVITIDLIGHGLSKVENSSDKIDKSVKHIKVILEQEGYEEAHLVGVSIGSLIAQYFAHQYPKSVKSLTVLGGYDINKVVDEITEFQSKGKIKKIFQVIFAMDSFRKDIALVTAKNSDSQVRFYEMSKLFTRKSFMIMSGLEEVVKDRKNVSYNFPLLILVGDSDIALSQKYAKIFNQNVKGSYFYIIKDAGHCANMDNEKEFNNKLMNFLVSIKTKSE